MLALTMTRLTHDVDFDESRAYGLGKIRERHDLSRQLIRICVGNYEAGAVDEDAYAAGLHWGYKAKIPALERMVGRHAPEIELLKGASKHAPRPRSANISIVTATGLGGAWISRRERK